MKNFNFIFTAVLCFLAFSAFSQTFETIDRIDWSVQTGLAGNTPNGTTWDATGNEANNCDGDGFFGVQGDAFVINGWEGSCGCPCGPDDPSTNCGRNDSEIDIDIPTNLVLNNCMVRLSIPVTASATLDCSDMTAADMEFGDCQEPGTDYMRITVTSFNGVTNAMDVEVFNICGTDGIPANGVVEIVVNDPIFIEVHIESGTQEVDEFYELGDILIEGVTSELTSVTIFPINSNNGAICENSSLPLILQTNVPSPELFDFLWSGPNSFSSTDTEVRFDQGDIDPSRQGTYTLQLTDANGCITIETVEISIIPATDAQCTSMPEFDFLGIQCSDVILPSVSDNGISGTWSPGAVLEQFAGQTLDFTFIPDEANISEFTMLIEVDDISRLDNFAIQPDPIPVFCNASTERYDFIDLFQMDLDLQLILNGEDDIFFFIQNNEIVQDVESQLRSLSLRGVRAGTRTFFIEASSPCGEVRTMPFSFLIVDETAPVVIDTTLCEGVPFEFMGMEFEESTFVPSTSQECGGGTQININRLPARRNLTPFLVSSLCADEAVYVYDTIDPNGNILGGVTRNFIPGLADAIDTIFTTNTILDDYVLPFPASNGCDSILPINITFRPNNDIEFIRFPLCENLDTMVQAGTQLITISASNPTQFVRVTCELGIDIEATIIPVQADSIIRTFCADQDTLIADFDGNMVLFNRDNPTATFFADSGANGCAESRFVDITFEELGMSEVNEIICVGGSVVVGTQVFTSATTEQVILPGASATGCDSIVMLNIELIEAEITATELTCDNPTSILTPTHNGTVMGWVGPDGFTSPDEMPEVSAPGIYTLIVAGPDGCTSEFPVNVTQDLMPPTVDAFGGEINCNNNGELTLSVTTDGTFVEWRGPNGFTSTEEMPTITEPGMYEAEAVGPNGCPMVDIVEVTADTIMPIGTTASDTIGCAGGPEVMLNLTTSDIFVEWTGPNGFVSTDINAMVSSGGLYQATIQGANGCEAQVDLEIIEDFTVPAVTASDITLDCDGTPVDLIADTDGMITGWTGPDGFSSTEASPIATTPGIYMVTVVGANGCDTTAMLEVFESGPFPEADALGGDINCFNSGELELTLVVNSGAFVEWTGPDGFTSTEERPTVTVGGTYTALLVGANGCQDSVQAIVNEDLNLPVVTVDPAASITCASQGQVQLGATTDGNIIEWTGPDGFTSTDLSPFVTVAGTYTVIVVADNGCEDMATIDVAIDTDPVMVEAVDQVIECISLVATLEANTSGTIIEWTGPNNFSSTDPNPQVSEPGDYTVLVIGDNGCESSAVATVSDAPEGPEISNVNLESMCGTNEGTLMVISDGSVVEWIGPNFVSNEVSPTVTEEGEYTVTVINADGCPSTASIMVSFDSTLPQLAVSDDVLNCNNDSTLMLTAMTDAGTISWRGPGGFRSDELNPIVDFPGTYIITVTSDTGCEVTDSVMIDEDFVSPQVGVRNEVLSCSNDSTTRLQFTANEGMFLGWTGPGGFSSNEENPVITVPGVYIVSVQGDNGCINETPANIMAASEQATAIAEVTGMLTCDVSEVRISATSDGSIVNWTGPDGNVINDIAPLVSVPGTYTVMVESSTNCPGFASVEVIEDINPPNIMGEDVTIGCMNSTVQLSVTTDGDIRGWRDPNGVSIVEDSPVVDIPGTYQVEVEGDNGCIGTFDVEVIPDGDGPELTASIVGELDCGSTQAQLLAVSDVTDISWTGPNGFTSTETDPIVFEPGDYTVTAIGSNGCPSTETLSINFSGIDVQVGQINGSCEGVANGMFVLQNVSGAAPPFTVSGVSGDPVEVESFPFTFETLLPGDYNVQVLGSDGCMTIVDVTVPEIPAGTLSIEVTTIDLGAGEFDLDLNFDGVIADILWASNPALSCTDCPGPMVTITENSVFTVTITDDQGCMADAQVSLSLNPESIVNSIYIPNVMTTRSVSGNNRFYPQGNFGQTSRFSMQIFDRWGNEVFESLDELVNDPTSGWDGSFNGSQANSGVYVYIIEITNEQGSTEIFHGDITLIK